MSRVSTTPNTTPSSIAASDVIALFIHEARHQALQQTRDKRGAAMYVSSGAGQKNFSGKGQGGGRSGKGKGAKPKCDITCYNCGKPGHVKANCWGEGGDKAGQGPHQKFAKGSSKDGSAKKEESANTITAEKPEVFAFTCTSNFVELASLITIPKARLGAIVDSGASQHFCPDKSKFSNFVLTTGCPIRTADGKTV
jgi:hypothetical protein